MKQAIQILAIQSYILSGCKTEEKRIVPIPQFIVKEIPLDADTTFNSGFYFGDHLVIGQYNGKFLVFDSLFNRNDSIESILNRLALENFWIHRDSIIFIIKKKPYLLKENFKLQVIKDKPYPYYLFEDSRYLVNSCCAGEFGGAVFFLEKETGKTYSYFATCASQINYFDYNYVVSLNLAHLGGSMGFLTVKDPKTLYELAEAQKNHCNWYVEIDSLKNYYRTSKVGDVKFVEGPYNTMSLLTFPYKDSLYSILTNDSSTYLAVHTRDTILPRQLLLNRTVYFHYNNIIDASKKKISIFYSTLGSVAEAFIRTENQSGFLVVDGNTISFLISKKYHSLEKL